MIRLTFTVDNINTVIQVYNRIQIQRSSTEFGTYEAIDSLGPIMLSGGVSTYIVDDSTGVSTDWYILRYYSTITNFFSEWSSPILYKVGNIFYNPLYPEEINYEAAQKLTINRIRRLIGDPIRLRREYGEDAMASVHMDSKTFELPVTGWPVSIIMGGTNFNSLSNPEVDDYKYLKFNDYIGDICEECVTYSGCASDIEKTIPMGIDIWYYTFRHSDRQIMDAYDNCPPPPPLTMATTNADVYMLQTAIDLLRQELWEDSVEDGASIKDDTTNYNPEPGLRIRKQLLDDLEKKLEKQVKILMLSGISGVLID